MTEREQLLRELEHERLAPIPPPAVPVLTDEQRRVRESWDRLDRFQQRWEIE